MRELKPSILIVAAIEVGLMFGFGIDARAASPEAESDSKNAAKAVAATPNEATNPWDTPARLALFVAHHIETATFTDAGVKTDGLSGIALAFAHAGGKQAAKVAQKIDDANAMASALEEIALALAKAGDVRQTIDVAENIGITWRKNSLLNKVAITLIKAGHGMQACEVWEKIERPSVLALCRLASAQVEAGAKQQALSTLKQALDLDRYALNFIAPVMPAAGEGKQAVQLAQEIRSSTGRASVLRSIASSLVKADDIEQALEVAPLIEDAADKAFALSTIATAQIEAGDKEQALASLTQAVEVAEEIEITAAKCKASVLRDIASALARAGAIKQALEVAQKVEWTGPRTTALVSVALTQVASGDKQQALATLKQAVEGAPSMVFAEIKADGSFRRVPDLLRKGYREAALNAAHEIKVEIESRALNETVTAFAKIGDLKQALEVAGKIANARYTASAFRSIAAVAVEAGNREQALAALQKAAQYARKIEYSLTREQQLDEIAKTLAQAGAGKQAQVVAEKIQTPVRRASALCSLSIILAKTGNSRQALEVAEMIEIANFRRSALSSIASAFIESEGGSRAVELALKIENAGFKALVLNSVAWALAREGEKQQSLETLKQAVKLAQNNAFASDVVFSLSMTLATEPVTEYEQDDCTRPVARRMKEAFTPQEKQLAKQLVEAAQKN